MPEELQKKVKGALIAVGVVVVILGFLAYTSFSYLDYYQYGFKRQRSTAQVFTDRLYIGGRYLQGPDFDFKVYPASAKDILLSSTAVFSKDALEVHLNVEFQYFLRPSQLHILHQRYQLTYDSVIRSSAMDALKAAAVDFTTEQFIKDRNAVEEAMRSAVRARIGGRCCDADCSKTACAAGCIPIYNCTKESDMGLMVDMRYFHLIAVRVPERVYSRYLRALLLVEESQMERYKLEEAVVKKEVDEAVKTIDNEAMEVSENATAEASLIITMAGAESQKVKGIALSEGLQLAMNICSLALESHKISFQYLESLRDHGNAHVAVDFNNFVVGAK